MLDGKWKKVATAEASYERRCLDLQHPEGPKP
mgnify:CR=1 FL=1